ncbi:SpoIIIAH-like family protein [Eubacteriales bacterium OttesenSCG-928-G02]|nr:SpoIIIAH-like family protein [Eubacteriales bacterium OttesenSCG-928-G02]
MKFKEIIEKIKKYDYKKLMTSRNFIIAGSVLVIGLTVVAVSIFFGGDGGFLTVDNESKKILGNPVLVGNETSGQPETSEAINEIDDSDYFAVSVINRQRVRDEALEVLRSIANNPDVMPDTKEEAMLSIASMINEMTAETNIETLVKAKGFEECVAVISGNQCSIIVKSDDLLADQTAQILEVVLESTNITANNVKIRKR